MSDEESHSETEFYYPKDEEQAKSEQNNMSKVITDEDENFGNSQEELQKFVQEQKSENTVKKMSSDMKCFYRFLGEINKTNVQILDLPPEELDHLLGKFFNYKYVRKINGEEYEPSTLTGLQRSIQRFLSDSGSKMDILRDDEFAFSLKLIFIASFTEITASSPHVFKIQSQTGPIFASAFKIFKGQTLVNTGQCVFFFFNLSG